jgi:hypothetical protein
MPRHSGGLKASGYRFLDAALRLAVVPPLRFAGTFAPFLRASDSPIAMACLRLVTLRPDPLFSVPRFLRRMVRSTFLLALRPYFAI